MRQIIEASECVGKRITAIQLGNNDAQVVIVFDDETFVALRARRTYDGEAEIEVETSFSPLGWQHVDLQSAFGDAQAKAMHDAEVDRQAVERAKWLDRRKAELREELRKLESQE